MGSSNDKRRYYAAIDLKAFYASVECIDRHLDPLTTNLVVADGSRTDKTICLAVSPSLKSFGIPGRPRLFEVIQRVKEVNAERLAKARRVGLAMRGQNGSPFIASSYDLTALNNDPSLEVTYITAPPRMARYVELSAKIYATYLKYIAPEDIHPYSIDEVFIDLTNYLATYRMTAHELTMTMIRDVLYETGVTATAGIGSNLYLAKIAMDIVAKKMKPDKDGVRIAELDEISYRELLWDHRPLTDFWRIGHGTARKLERHMIYTMGELARTSTYDQEWFYKTFGIDAEILIDHAWGIEPTTMEDIKSYRPSTTSLCEGQVLTRPYSHEEARLIVQEMADSLVLQLAGKGFITDSLTLDVCYDRENVTGSYQGEVHIDHYGRAVPKPVHGSTRLIPPTNLGSKIISAATAIYDRITDPQLLVRRITIGAGNLTEDGVSVQLDMFTDTESAEKEKNLQTTLLDLKSRFGKNAVLRGTSYMDGATMRERNGQIGGHKA